MRLSGKRGQPDSSSVRGMPGGRASLPELTPGAVLLRRPVEGRSIELFIIAAASPGCYLVTARQTSNGAVFSTDHGYLNLLRAYKALRLLSLVLRAGQDLSRNLIINCELGAEVDLRPSNRNAAGIVKWFTSVIGSDPFMELRNMGWVSLPDHLRERFESDETAAGR